MTLNRRQRREATISEFHNARRLVSEAGEKLWCEDRPEMYVDYEMAATPSDEEAKARCEPCDLKKLCDRYAQAAKEDWGVWGGYVYLHGKKLVTISALD